MDVYHERHQDSDASTRKDAIAALISVYAFFALIIGVMGASLYCLLAGMGVV